MLIQAGHLHARTYTLAQIEHYARAIAKAEASRRMAAVHDVRAAMSADDKGVTKHLRALAKIADRG